MKIAGARTETFSAIRRRALTRAGTQATGQSNPADAAAFLAEVDDLRSEVGRLKSSLAEIENMADQDVLTPLLNRRAFVRELRRFATFAQSYGSKAGLVYFDLDGFKAVNDRFGRAALQAVAQRLLDNMRDSDVVGRMGGDEFAVAMVQADHETAMTKAQSLAQVIEATPVTQDK